MDPTSFGHFGAILGSIVGVAGGIVGTWCSFRSANGPSERDFTIRSAIVIWVLVLAFIAGLFLLPQPYNYLLWIPYPLLLVLGIFWMNRRCTELRAPDATSKR